MSLEKQNGSQMRITEEEQELIKSTFKNNESLLKLLRKMFLPELDPDAPVGQMIDLYRTILTKDREPQQIAVDLTARNMVIDHVENVLLQLLLISKQESTTPEQMKEKAKINSVR
jgi:hypothetical protein